MAASMAGYYARLLGSAVSTPRTQTPRPESGGRWRLAWAGLAAVTCALSAAAIVLNHNEGGSMWLQRLNMRSPAKRPAPLPKLPWAPLLSGEEQAAGVAHYGGGRRLHRLAQKLLAGQPIKAFTLGGSVSFGHGVQDAAQDSYPARFFQFLNASFPHRDHVLRNAGLPGATSPVVVPCVDWMIEPDPDLVVVEFSVNDSPAAYTSPARHAYEQLIRQLLAMPSQPAVVLLHHYAWWKAEGDGVSSGLFYREPEGQLTLYSHYYDIPSLSLRSASWRLMQSGIDGFKVDAVISEGNRVASSGEPIPAAPPGSQASYLYLDTIHPGPSGHQVLAELLAGLVARAVAELASGLVPSARQDSRLEGLPPPMSPKFEEERASLCAQLEDFKAVVKRQRGFDYRPEKPALPTWVEQKWGWAGSEPGSWAELEVDTRPAPGTRSKQAQVLLSHLRSHAGMGTADVACISGCTCKPNVLDGTSASRATVFKIHSFKVSQDPRCRIRVTIREQPGEVAQEGHKVMLAAIMVTHHT